VPFLHVVKRRLLRLRPLTGQCALIFSVESGRINSLIAPSAGKSKATFSLEVAACEERSDFAGICARWRAFLQPRPQRPAHPASSLLSLPAFSPSSPATLSAPAKLGVERC
jgi:hypothetical protein